MKKMNTIAIAIILVANASFGQKQEITRIDGSKISITEIDNTVNRLMNEANVQGLSLSIINNREQAYTKTYEFKNKERNELRTSLKTNYFNSNQFS